MLRNPADMWDLVLRAEGEGGWRGTEGQRREEGGEEGGNAMRLERTDPIIFTCKGRRRECLYAQGKKR
jgi:hypothetical protein